MKAYKRCFSILVDFFNSARVCATIQMCGIEWKGRLNEIYSNRDLLNLVRYYLYGNFVFLDRWWSQMFKILQRPCTCTMEEVDLICEGCLDTRNKNDRRVRRSRKCGNLPISRFNLFAIDEAIWDISTSSFFCNSEISGTFGKQRNPRLCLWFSGHWWKAGLEKT